MFRFDLIRSPGDVRISFLANKRTSEMFRYEPFSCSLMRGDISQDRGAAISADLAGVFPLDSSDTLLPVGIGALWLHALKLDSTFTADVCHHTTCHDIDLFRLLRHSVYKAFLIFEKKSWTAMSNP